MSMTSTTTAVRAGANFVLRAPARARVQWALGTVDNEHLGRKRSKCCCIYHKPRAFDESDDESGGESSDIDSNIYSGGCLKGSKGTGQ
jgi:protein phosphatase 1 regulatory subunit 11